MTFLRTIAALALSGSVAVAADLAHAVIFVPQGASGPEKKAAQMLSEEIAKRTQLRLEVTGSAPAAGRPVIALGMASELGSRTNGLPAPMQGADGYRVKAGASGVVIAGNDPRGTLFGAGYLLRHLRMERQVLEVDDSLQISTAPRYPLRGHQLGYRPKVNAYDGWTPAQFEQYIRDLAVFGTNAIELIPPRSDDDADSPHFLLPKIEMMVEISRICDEYGTGCLDLVSGDGQGLFRSGYRRVRAEGMGRGLPPSAAHRRRSSCPGGDPGHTRAEILMALLEKQTAVAAQISSESADVDVAAELFRGMDGGMVRHHETSSRRGSSGVVYGPQVRIHAPATARASAGELPDPPYPGHHPQPPQPISRARLGSGVRTTEGREVINPRPTQRGQHLSISTRIRERLSHLFGRSAMTMSTSSSGAGWDGIPTRHVDRHFARFRPLLHRRAASPTDSRRACWHWSETGWARWRPTTAWIRRSQQFQAMERTASPQVLENWRFQQALYRAYYDYYNRARLIYETQLENQAWTSCGRRRGSARCLAMDEAERDAQSRSDPARGAMGARPRVRDGRGAVSKHPHAVERSAI